MATGPKIIRDPIELLTPDPNRIQPFMDKIFGGLMFGTLTFAGYALSNYSRKVPIMSGMHLGLTLTAIAAGIGHWIDTVYRPANFAERDAKFRHYISLHPQDFPIEEPKKYADVFEPWFPIR